MRHLSRILFFGLLMAMSISMSVAQAADIALMVAGSARYNMATTDLPNATVTGKASFGGGFLGVAPISGNLAFRSGFLVSTRYVDIGPTTTGTTEINFVYIDVPLTPMLLLTNSFGVFAGPIVAMNVVKDCSSGTSSCSTNTKSVILPLTIGMQVRFAGQLGGEFFFERSFGSIADHVSDFTTLGANVLFYFD